MTRTLTEKKATLLHSGCSERYIYEKYANLTLSQDDVIASGSLSQSNGTHIVIHNISRWSEYYHDMPFLGLKCFYYDIEESYHRNNRLAEGINVVIGLKVPAMLTLFTGHQVMHTQSCQQP